ncbi:MAG TPA: DUF3800 domain-containing protein [Patescibacteria group bacterium]|nr:DUF3800 domain-containing protein [Patescibacteria group bacterium]
MIVFIDESGDPGFSLSGGSSRVFVIVCVVFDDELEAEKAAVAIKELRRKLKFSDRTEFKFNGSRKKVRIAFLQTVKPYLFKIRALVVKKESIRSPILKANKNSFYSFFIKTILTHTRGTIMNAKIRIDGSGDRLFRRNFLTYLRKELNTNERKVMKNIRLVDSRSNVLIQMADMIAGTIRRYKEGEKIDARGYWDIIKRKVEDCWDFR